MHPGDGVNKRVGEDGKLDRSCARAAAQWLATLLSGQASAADHAAFAQWRDADPEHERAWQFALQVQRQLGLLTPEFGLKVLGRPRAQLGKRKVLRGFGLFAAAAAAGHLAWRGWGDELGADLRTAVGERLDSALPDGSVLRLNTDTAVDVRFSALERRVGLRRGELMVETARDAARPFLVGTAWGELQAMGTRFLVRAAAGHGRVTVYQGAVAVRLAAGAGQATVGPGQAMDFTAREFGPRRQADAHAAGWTRGLLIAQEQRLDDFLAELGRHRHGLLQCDPAVAHLRLTGAFQLDRGDAALDALADTLPVRVVWHTRWWARVLPRD